MSIRVIDSPTVRILKNKVAAQETELSRLRELVKGMREALLTLHDFTDSFNVSGVYANEDPDVKRALCASASALDKADAALKESGEPVKYGCHCELGPGEAPDGCVIDEGRPLDCVYTRQSSKAGIARKEDCKHWRPIK